MNFPAENSLNYPTLSNHCSLSYAQDAQEWQVLGFNVSEIFAGRAPLDPLRQLTRMSAQYY